MNNIIPTQRGNYHLRAFLLGLGLAFLMFIPFIIYHGGAFVYYGDFNSQQIAFYQLAHSSIRSGNFGWSYLTDLGSNFIGSYSFYLLGSPFFWLTIPFPNEAVKYLMGPLLILKFSCASLTAYTYLNRYVKDKNFALVGAILYAFSGFSVHSVFFNHFHEAIVIFPLLLASIDEYMETNRRGIVAVAVCFACIFNYYFFVGQVVFAVIYFFVKLSMGNIKISLKNLSLFALECVLGLGMSAILLFPSLFVVLQNSRVDSQINGWDALVYSNTQRYVHIIQSLFFIPDSQGHINFTPDSNSEFSSIAAWIPLFGMTGTIAWLKQKRKHWLKNLIVVLLICVFVPVFNSAFQLFNSLYYARWFYMLTLMLALATIMSLDSKRMKWKSSIKLNVYISLAIIILIGLMPNLEVIDGVEHWSLGLYDNALSFWLYALISLICLAVVTYLIYFSKKENFTRNCLRATCIVCVCYGIFFMTAAKIQALDPDKHFVPNYLNGGDEIDLEDMDVSRSDFYETLNNAGMYWQVPTIQAFHSIVTDSISEYYEFIGVGRYVTSSPDVEKIGVRGLLSVKWLFDDDNYSGEFADEDLEHPLMQGFTYYGNENGFDIWENEYYIPMGFSYDKYILQSDAEMVTKDNIDVLMLQAIVIPDEDEEIWSKYLTEFDKMSFSQQTYVEDCIARAETSCEFFEYTNTGFVALHSSDEDEIVFFSVPYEIGWSAKVGGEEAEILKSNIGFMSVIVPAGEAVNIEFTYKTPWLFTGICTTVLSALLLVVYLVIVVALRRRKISANERPYSMSRT